MFLRGLEGRYDSTSNALGLFEKRKHFFEYPSLNPFHNVLAVGSPRIQPEQLWSGEKNMFSSWNVPLIHVVHVVLNKCQKQKAGRSQTQWNSRI